MISILLPVKDESKYIEECLTSIQNQTYTDWELVIVDDHSTDETRDLIQKNRIAKQDKCKLFENEGNGLIDALITGLKHTSGTYITRMDGDDLMTPERLKIMHETIISTTSPSIVCGQVAYISPQEISDGYKTYEHWLNQIQQQQTHLQWMYRECVFASPNWMMKTKDLLAIGGFNKLAYPEDYAHALNCYEHNIQFVGIPVVTLKWRQHPERMSLLDEGYHQSAFFQLKINHWIKTHYNPNRKVILWGKNQKTKLTERIFKKQNVHVNAFNMKNVHDSLESVNPLILINVFPSLKERENIRLYIKKAFSNSLKEGRDYWFL